MRNLSGTPESKLLLSRRSLLGQVFLGSAAALALSACGGGGSSSSDSDETIDLLAVFNNLGTGMTVIEVKALVGREPDSFVDLAASWSEGNQRLDVYFRLDGGVISGARWDQLIPSKTKTVVF